jgi:hypothetical protein
VLRRVDLDLPTSAQASTTSARLLRHATSARILQGGWSLTSSSVARELPQTAAASPSPSSTAGLPPVPGVCGRVPFPIWTRRCQPAPSLAHGRAFHLSCEGLLSHTSFKNVSINLCLLSHKSFDNISINLRFTLFGRAYLVQTCIVL